MTVSEVVSNDIQLLDLDENESSNILSNIVPTDEKIIPQISFSHLNNSSLSITSTQELNLQDVNSVQEQLQLVTDPPREGSNLLWQDVFLNAMLYIALAVSVWGYNKSLDDIFADTLPALLRYLLAFMFANTAVASTFHNLVADKLSMLDGSQLPSFKKQRGESTCDYLARNVKGGVIFKQNNEPWVFKIRPDYILSGVMNEALKCCSMSNTPKQVILNAVQVVTLGSVTFCTEFIKMYYVVGTHDALEQDFPSWGRKYYLFSVAASVLAKSFEQWTLVNQNTRSLLGSDHHFGVSCCKESTFNRVMPKVFCPVLISGESGSVVKVAYQLARQGLNLNKIAAAFIAFSSAFVTGYCKWKVAGEKSLRMMSDATYGVFYINPKIYARNVNSCIITLQQNDVLHRILPATLENLSDAAANVFAVNNFTHSTPLRIAAYGGILLKLGADIINKVLVNNKTQRAILVDGHNDVESIKDLIRNQHIAYLKRALGDFGRIGKGDGLQRDYAKFQSVKMIWPSSSVWQSREPSLSTEISQPLLPSPTPTDLKRLQEVQCSITSLEGGPSKPNMDIVPVDDGH